ncbi:hypothetical protein PV396_27355 [Streptomyces sp. ME02-8801-2C]|uniref:hypothetical protein n=1 Tax=Streptomyces sp. ME02-8801-2C TaxID=3028680 RepID=UPI0029A9BC80|nr:hypothetical protein [Streptomyces sp. ME02-8801-2C]MDX3455611.1 hypothetical protein [Streptomyces sp. ME02-8801-2C]
MNGDDGSRRQIWLAIIVLGALLGGGIAAAACWAAGMGVIAALGAGGSTFLGLALLGLAAGQFLAD